MKLLKSFLIGSLIFCFSHTVNAEVENMSNWGNLEIYWGQSNNIISSDENMDISSNLSRAKFVDMLYKSKGSPESKGTITFEDIKKDETYYDAIKWAYNNGIIYGVSDKKFNPYANISREDMITILYRDHGEKNEKSNDILANYVDFDSVSDYARDSFIWSIENKIIYGYTENLLKPKENTTLAQGLSVLMRYDENISRNIFNIDKIKNLKIFNGGNGLHLNLDSESRIEEIKNKLNEFKYSRVEKDIPKDGYSYILEFTTDDDKQFKIVFHGKNKITIGDYEYTVDEENYFENNWSSLLLFSLEESNISEIILSESRDNGTEIVKDRDKIKSIVEKINETKFIEKEVLEPRDGWEYIIKIVHKDSDHEYIYKMHPDGIEINNILFKTGNKNYFDEIWKSEFKGNK
ncbi:MAG: S-layer homology domain-containing protein [Andreesenia angusta]|nr:S-layer homology domain-containing protein [Andreesenia angusta]